MPTGNTRGSSRTRCARSRRGSRITASTRSTSISPTCIRRSRNGGPRTGVRSVGARARSRRAIDQGCRARGDGAFLLDRHRAEQAPGEDRLRARQAGRTDAAASRRHGTAHLAAAPRARSTASDRSRARSSKRSASHDRRSGRGRSRVARRAFRSRARRVHARRRARSRRARRHHRDGAEVDQPRDDVRARSVGAARPRGALADLHRAVHGRERRSAAQGLSSARRSASSFATTTSRR